MFNLIRIAVVWDSLPDEIGVHFASNGEFDMIDSKNYVAYPYIFSIAVLVFCEISALLSDKIKMGLKINQKGDIKIRTALKILLDISKLGFTLFFAGIWADCVIRQIPIHTDTASFIALAMLISFFIFIIAVIVIKIKNPPE